MRKLLVDILPSHAVQLQPIPISMGPEEMRTWFQIIHLSITSLFEKHPLTIIIPKDAIQRIYIPETERRTLSRVDEHDYYAISVLCIRTSPVLRELITQNEEFSRGLLWFTTISYKEKKQLGEIINLLSSHNLIELPETNKQVLTMNNDGDLLLWLNPQFPFSEIHNAIQASASKYGWQIIQRSSS
jgi:hypothetical protein